MTQIQKADPGARTRALRYTLLVFVCCFILILLFLYNRDRLVDAIVDNLDMLLANSWLVLAVMLAVMSPVFVVGIYLLALGRRIAQAERFPPPGDRVLRDTRVMTGEAARQRGKLGQFAGVLVIVCGIAVSVLFWRGFVNLLA